jgi:protein-S-isoprenylcysteine O-methyltransferase Ste14
LLCCPDHPDHHLRRSIERAGFLNLLLFIPFYFLRARAEEQMMLEQFGDQYRTYMQKVGAVFPKF